MPKEPNLTEPWPAPPHVLQMLKRLQALAQRQRVQRSVVGARVQRQLHADAVGDELGCERQGIRSELLTRFIVQAIVAWRTDERRQEQPAHDEKPPLGLHTLAGSSSATPILSSAPPRTNRTSQPASVCTAATLSAAAAGGMPPASDPAPASMAERQTVITAHTAVGDKKRRGRALPRTQTKQCQTSKDARPAMQEDVKRESACEEPRRRCQSRACCRRLAVGACLSPAPAQPSVPSHD